MKFYAQLNENNICVGVSQLSGEVLRFDMIEIDEQQMKTVMSMKYENSEWSEIPALELAPEPPSLNERVTELEAAVNTIVGDDPIV